MNYPVIDYIEKNYDSKADKKEYLPFVHSCDAFTLESIIEEGILSTSLCPVFKKDYLYFFYGKPAYRVAQSIKENRSDYLHLPCCLIFKNEKINTTKIFPFDSGGFENKLYEKFFHKKMKIEKFELENSLQGVSKYVHVFFGDNDEYINGIAKRNVSENAYIESLSNLLLAEGSYDMDERSRTVEVITEQNVELKNSLLGIVLPIILMRQDGIRNFINQSNIKYATYNFRPMTKAVEYNQVVFERVMSIIGKSGIL